MPLTQAIRDEAWTGDAVLGLYAREIILKGEFDVYGLARQELYAGLTCNQFLSAFGEPTQVEAEIGRQYHETGLEGAFAWMEERLLPQFRKQLNRQQRARRKRA